MRLILHILIKKKKKDSLNFFVEEILVFNSLFHRYIDTW